MRIQANQIAFVVSEYNAGGSSCLAAKKEEW
jgi:hypothetical protein